MIISNWTVSIWIIIHSLIPVPVIPYYKVEKRKQDVDVYVLVTCWSIFPALVRSSRKEIQVLGVWEPNHRRFGRLSIPHSQDYTRLWIQNRILFLFIFIGCCKAIDPLLHFKVDEPESFHIRGIQVIQQVVKLKDKGYE